jgi:hypothetical protein
MKRRGARERMHLQGGMRAMNLEMAGEVDFYEGDKWWVPHSFPHFLQMWEEALLERALGCLR